MADLGVGTVIGGLRIDGAAGRGGMGVVYRATQLALNRTVAMKVVAPDLASDPEFRERFKRESELAASIDHPHVVPIFHAGEEDELLYVTMRFVEGTDLRQLILRNGRLDPRQAAEIVSQVAGALDAAHARGLVHRDVKPANILIGSGVGGAMHAYLTDFGLSKLAASGGGLTKTGEVLGTVDYIAPEQLEGHAIDGRADVYALGCVLYEALTGMVPFPRDSDAAKMWAHIGQPPPMLGAVAPHLPREIDEVLRRAMAKRPAERFSSAGEFGRAAVAACNTSTVQGRPGTQPVPGAGDPLAPVWSGSSPGSPSAAGAATNWLAGPGVGYSPPSGPGSAPGLPSGAGYQAAFVPPATPGVQRSRLPLLLSIIGVVVAIALAAGVVAFVAGRTPPAPPVPTAAGEIIGSAIKVGEEPSFIVAGGGFLWTANTDTISKIDPATGTSTEIVVGGVAYQLAVDQGAVWVSNFSNAVVRVDIASGQVSDPIDTGPGEISTIAAGGGYLWLSHAAEGTVSRLDMSTRKIDGQPLAVGGSPFGMAFSDGLLYVVNSGDQTLVTLDGSTGQLVGTPLSVKNANGSIGVHDGVIYLGTPDGVNSQLTPVDERSFIIGDPIPLKGSEYFAIGGGSLWLSYPLENVIRRFELVTFAPRGEPIRGVGKGAASIEFIDGTLLVVNGVDNTVVRVRPTP